MRVNYVDKCLSTDKTNIHTIILKNWKILLVTFSSHPLHRLSAINSLFHTVMLYRHTYICTPKM